MSGGRSSPDPDVPGRFTPGRWLEILIALILPAAVLAALYLAPFASDPTTMPFGVDTTAYIWRVNVVHDLGIGALTPEATNAPKPLGDRPGYPLVLSLLRSVTGLSSLSLMWLTPALFATALGLAAGSLASDGALERRSRSGAIAVAVGGSAFVAWTAVGYGANLAFDVVAMAAAVMALEVARGRRGVWGGAVLLAGGILLHWMFAFLFISMLGVAGLIQWLRSRDRAEGSQRIAVRRILAMLVLGSTLGGIGLLASPQLPGRLPQVGPDSPGPAKRVELRLPALALPVTLPLAPLGAGLLAFDRRRARRNAGVLLATWSSLAVVSVAAWFLLGLPLPPYRWAGFALAIPAAIVLGAFAASDAMVRWGRRRIGVVALVAGLIASVSLAGVGASVWWGRGPQLVAGEFAQLRTLSSYLEPLPPRTRVVILIAAYRQRAPFNRAWAELPAARLPFVTMVPARIDVGASGLGLPPIARERPGSVVVVLDAFRKPVDVGITLGPGVHLISGPDPRGVEIGVPPRAPPPVGLALSVVVLLGVLLLVGGGWASLTDLPALGIVSVAPAFGLAILSTTGLVASRSGIPLRGPWGAGVVATVGVAGWVTSFVRRGRRA